MTGATSVTVPDLTATGYIEAASLWADSIHVAGNQPTITLTDENAAADVGRSDIVVNSGFTNFLKYDDDGTNPFYFMFHSFGGSNIPEAEVGTGATNDIPADAETNAEFIGNSTGGYSGAFVEGNLAGGDASDVDWFEFPISDFGVSPDSTWSIGGACSAQRIGSGLRVLNLTLEDQAGGEIHSANESPDESATFGDGGKAFPSGSVTSLLLKVSAGSQDADVAGDYYRCGVVLIPPDA